MLFTEIQAYQFRNLSSLAIPVDSRQVLLVGENGQGKTNFLEAVYMLCYGSSFRTPFLREMATQGRKEFSLKATFRDEENSTHESSLIFRNNKRTIFIDGRQISDRKELIYTIPCIVFCHEDIWFVNGEPEQRRKFFDQTMSMYNPLFFDDLRRYRQILRQRNQAIKDDQASLLPVYDIQLASYGQHIQEARTRAVHEFNQIFPSLYRDVSGSDWNLSISYLPSWKECASKEEIQAVLEKTRERDFLLQTTTSGIHRDRFTVMRDSSSFASIASTGQIRLASLLFRIAQMVFFKQKTGRNPIILVDDVLLELDHEKRAKFLETMKEYEQAFFTFLPEERYFRSLSSRECRVYTVEQGRFEPHETL